MNSFHILIKQFEIHKVRSFTYFKQSSNFINWYLHMYIFTYIVYNIPCTYQTRFLYLYHTIEWIGYSNNINISVHQTIIHVLIRLIKYSNLCAICQLPQYPKYSTCLPLHSPPTPPQKIPFCGLLVFVQQIRKQFTVNWARSRAATQWVSQLINRMRYSSARLCVCVYVCACACTCVWQSH